MSVWGIGAFFPGEKEDVAKKYIEYGTAVIGYSEEDKPKPFKLLRSIQAGDLIFIKARFMPTQPLKVKAIGIALGSEVSVENGMDGKKGIKVHWIKDFTNDPWIIEKGREYDGDTRTIYQETNGEIIRQIVKLL